MTAGRPIKASQFSLAGRSPPRSRISDLKACPVVGLNIPSFSKRQAENNREIFSLFPVGLGVSLIVFSFCI